MSHHFYSLTLACSIDMVKVPGVWDAGGLIDTLIAIETEENQ